MEDDALKCCSFRWNVRIDWTKSWQLLLKTQALVWNQGVWITRRAESSACRLFTWTAPYTGVEAARTDWQTEWTGFLAYVYLLSCVYTSVLWSANSVHFSFSVLLCCALFTCHYEWIAWILFHVHFQNLILAAACARYSCQASEHQTFIRGKISGIFSLLHKRPHCKFKVSMLYI